MKCAGYLSRYFLHAVFSRTSKLSRYILNAAGMFFGCRSSMNSGISCRRPHGHSACGDRRSFMYATPAFLSLWRTARRASAHVRLRKLPFKSVSRAFAVVAADVRAAAFHADSEVKQRPFRRCSLAPAPGIFPHFSRVFGREHGRKFVHFRVAERAQQGLGVPQSERTQYQPFGLYGIRIGTLKDTKPRL